MTGSIVYSTNGSGSTWRLSGGELARSQRGLAFAWGLAVWRGFGQFEVIHHPVRRQLGEHDYLLDRHGRVPVRAFQIAGEIARHHTGLGQGFAGVGQQVFVFDIGGKHEHRAGFAGGR